MTAAVSAVRSATPSTNYGGLLTADLQVVLLADVISAKVAPRSVAARAGWSNIAAVRAQRIYAIDADVANRPGPRIVDAIEEIARALYPDRFPR